MTSDKRKQIGLFILASAALGALLGLLGSALDLSPGVRGGLTGGLIPLLYVATRPRKPAQAADRSTGAP